jgi:hypothetical protein
VNSESDIYNISVPLLTNIRTTLEMIKWEHSIFALPFALVGAMLAADGLPSKWQLIWIVETHAPRTEPSLQGSFPVGSSLGS